MRIGRRNRRRDRGDRELRPLRFEYCCGAECDDECRRTAMHEAVTRMSPQFGFRIG